MLHAGFKYLRDMVRELCNFVQNPCKFMQLRQFLICNSNSLTCIQNKFRNVESFVNLGPRNQKSTLMIFLNGVFFDGLKDNLNFL